MIVRPPQHWLRMVFTWRGSVLSAILPRLGLNLVFALAVVLLYGRLEGFGITLSIGPFSLIGIALAIFLGFRNNSSYDRFWEARKLYGGVLVQTRSLLRQAITLTGRAPDDPEIARFRDLLVAYTYSLKHQLRQTDPAADLQRLLTAELAHRLQSAQFRPALALRELGAWVAAQRDAGRLSDVLVQALDANLDKLSDILGSCERIANTPLPYAYSVLLHRTIYLYCTLLPLGLVDSIGWLTPLISVFVAYTFMALETIAGELETPFGTEPNDLALDAISRSIERSLLELTDAAELPPPLLPDGDYILR
ncbi:bestrophin family protein [Chitinolyticbacter meiyuanensis]|uniref:bestrophin family protein n=1 Tax=Chitinolyticbacter meiyuanensis TaxID=682798 RepID=UPI0011E5D13C|nr:bestrophin family ion channel [Chitinolyticbacter meiyuanensis]